MVRGATSSHNSDSVSIQVSIQTFICHTAYFLQLSPREAHSKIVRRTRYRCANRRRLAARAINETLEPWLEIVLEPTCAALPPRFIHFGRNVKHEPLGITYRVRKVFRQHLSSHAAANCQAYRMAIHTKAT